MKKVFIICLLVAFSAVLISQEADPAKAFNDELKKVRDFVRKTRNGNKDATAQARELFKKAEDVNQKYEASRVLADALRNQKNYLEAAEIWKSNTEFVKERGGKNAAREMMDAVRGMFWNYERAKPFPAKDMEQAARDAWNWEGKDTYSSRDKRDIVSGFIKAVTGAAKPEEAIKALETVVEKDEFGSEMKSLFLLEMGQQALKAQDQAGMKKIIQGMVEDETLSLDDRIMGMLRLAQALDREGKTEEALEWGLKALEKLKETKPSNISWEVNNNMKWIGSVARDKLLKYDTAMDVFNTMLELNTSDYWKIPFNIEIAMVYRRMKEYEKAEALYQEAAKNERYKPRIEIPRAEMYLYNMKDWEKGEPLFVEMLNDTDINGIERYRAVYKLADHLKAQREYDKAAEWILKIPGLPNSRKKDIAKETAKAYLEVGQIRQIQNRIEDAKEMFRKARDTEGGDTRARVTARDTLEDIEYFE